MAKDDVLISRAQAGDEQAFTDLVKSYHTFVDAIVSGVLDDLGDVEEVVQDAFINAYHGLPQLKDTASFNGWLAEIARNCARDRLRKHRLETVPIDEVGAHTLETSDSADAHLIRDEQIELIRRAMETLSQKDREIARAYYLDGASYNELIRTHGLSYKAISFRLSRAKRTLRKRLRHLLSGVFVPTATTLKKISSGGLTAMKIGTAPKITVGVIVIIALVFIGLRQLLSPEGDSSPSTEVTASTAKKPELLVPENDTTRRNVVTAPSRADEQQYSAEEMDQIEDFFAQLEADDAQSNTAELAGTEIQQDADEHVTINTDFFGEGGEDMEQSAEEMMDAYVEAFKNLDFEGMSLLMTGSAKEGMNKAAAKGFPLMTPEETKDLPTEARQMVEQMMIEFLSRVRVVNSEYVGDEFHFELGGPPPEIKIPGIVISEVRAPNELYKMRKEGGVWRIYESETLD